MNILRRFFVKADKKYLSRIINDITNNVHLYIHVSLEKNLFSNLKIYGRASNKP